LHGVVIWKTRYEQVAWQTYLNFFRKERENMADLNEVRLIGRLTRDPEFKSGQTWEVSNFGLATGRKYKAKDGNVVEETTFVDISCFGGLAKPAKQYLKKGRLVFIGGRLKLDTWEKHGEKKQKLSVIADNVQFLDKSNGKTQMENNNESSFDEPPF
jgi:single-strand DNA-binding protein